MRLPLLLLSLPAVVACSQACPRAPACPVCPGSAPVTAAVPEAPAPASEEPAPETLLVRTEHLAGEAWWTRSDACPATAHVVKYVDGHDVVIGCFHDEPNGARVNEGRLTRWYANGAVQEQALYERGKLVEQLRYWESGLLQAKLVWLDRSSDRYRMEWFAYEDGGIQMSREMQGTQPDGREIRYYSDGKVEQERRWKNGAVVPGSARGYTRTGAPASRELDWSP